MIMVEVTKIWWDGERLMAEPVDSAIMYKDNEVAQPDSTCNNTLCAEGKGYPRTCKKCGKGPCIADRVQPEQRPPDAIPDAFNEWWNADYDDTGNPFRKDSPAYWAWSGWKAASKQPEQEPVAAECKFVGTKEWGRCSIEHHNLVQSEPHNWPKYQTRLLYTSPPKRTWVGMTDEERMDVLLALNWDKQLTHMDTAKSIEAKLNEKNT